MRIIGGLAKGHRVWTPKGPRPTSTLLKRKLFDAHQDWGSVDFVDLCAGSGAVGLEAWSRGAKSVSFVENGHNRGALRALKKNRSLLAGRFPTEIRQRPLKITSSSIQSWFSWWHPRGETVFYFDPPYNLEDIYIKGLRALRDLALSGATFWIETSRHGPISREKIEEFLPVTRAYAHASSVLYRAVCP